MKATDAQMAAEVFGSADVGPVDRSSTPIVPMIDPFEHHLRLHIAETQAAFDDALRARQLQDTGRAVLLHHLYSY